jgi:Na+-transporting NADH:ubiquinone oxidoreductase subunit C
MAKQHSTAYIFGFAAGVCVFFSILVSTAAVSLKERQEANKLLDRQEKVLVVAGLKKEDVDLPPAEISSRFEDNIVARVIDLETGEYADDIDVNSFDQRKAAKDATMSVEAPENLAKVLRTPKNAIVYHVKEDGEVAKVIIPIEGKGLWSTMYGYLALDADTTTIAGITFYEDGETPGLGGEINNPNWKAKWKGRKAFDESWKPAIEVIKGMAGPAAEQPFAVDGLSGATITSRGVTYTMDFWLGDNGFGPYLVNFRKGKG